jgi:hypothetical protein
MELKFLIKEPPGEIALLAREISKTKKAGLGHYPFDIVTPHYTGSKSHITDQWVGVSPEELRKAGFVEIEILVPGKTTVDARVIAAVRSDGQSELALKVKDADWDKVEQWWELLRGEMDRRGWFEKSQPISQEQPAGGVGEEQVKKGKHLPTKTQRGKRPKEPKVTEESVGTEAFRAAWCEYKYQCDKYHGKGKAFTHKDLADKLGLSEQGAKNYYHYDWVPVKK